MNAIPSSRSSARRLLICLAIFLLAAGLIVYGVTSYFRLSADARSLRNGLAASLESQALSFHKTIELNVGPLTLYAVRAGLSLVDLKLEARAGLEAVRATGVGVYKLSARAGRANRTALLKAADEAMDRRGWDRMVGAVHEGSLVAVYVPRTPASGENVEACVAVLNESDLVIVTARTDLEPLMELAVARPEWKERIGAGKGRVRLPWLSAASASE